MIEYTTIAEPCEGSVTEKRSEFIAQLFNVIPVVDAFRNGAQSIWHLVDFVKGEIVE